MNDVKRQRLAGVFFIGAVADWAVQSPLIAQGSVPVVHTGEARPDLGISSIKLDNKAFYTMAMDRFAEKGCKRVAIIHDPLSGELKNLLDSGLASRGIDTRAYWTHRVGIANPQAARSIAHVLMRLPVQDRPDALLITDDNAVEHALSGLVDAGVRGQDRLEIIGHCNFPWPAPSVMPMARLGYDTRQVLREAVQHFDTHEPGDAVRQASIAPRWELSP
jgi:DNA-binding LacI/PurR family transcriptional regulator